MLKDEDADVLFDGPLTIFVNSYSASASEILAAAMQDYNRAFIVGDSKSTFGKGTVQRFFDLDQLARGVDKKYKPLGAVKITIQKFYRINGGATQLKGVEPDVILPDNFTYMKVGEKELEYPLPWDEITSVPYSDYSEFVPNKQKLIRDLEKKRDQNKTFKTLDENARRLERNRNDSEIPLNLSEFRERQESIREENKKYKDIISEIDDLEITIVDPFNSPFSEASQDSVYIASLEDFKENLKKDIYIYETMRSMEESN